MTYNKNTIEFAPKPTNSRFVDIQGCVFDRLTVLGYAGSNSRHEAQWWCECVCATIKRVSGSNLRRMDNRRCKSCGCLQKERASQGGRKNKRHGMTHTRAYGIWSGMKNRCQNSNAADFERYGRRGITVCDRWQSFENFYTDMGEPPTGLTLERIDNELGYFPDNCKWGTQEEQGNNKRTTLRITFNGKTQSLTQWSRVLHIKIVTLRTRLFCLNWSIDKAFTTPVATRFRRRPETISDSIQGSNV